MGEAPWWRFGEIEGGLAAIMVNICTSWKTARVCERDGIKDGIIIREKGERE